MKGRWPRSAKRRRECTAPRPSAPRRGRRPSRSRSRARGRRERRPRSRRRAPRWNGPGSISSTQVVQPGQPLLAIVPLDDIWVTANFKEGELRDIRPGQPVTIKVDAYGRDYKGRVDSIAAATGARFSLLPPENATGNFVKVVQRVPVKITIDRGQDPDHLLRPGMSVVPTVHTK
ncbi:MAG: hypothetical protein DMF77_09105 [Acidobacteria bacterium]|nr:MAG: hypothetical protein DMF77_09105 [Acidobacteriota bacterium]